jgi:hypothetical protein
VLPNSQDAVKLKAVVLNTLYGTNVIAISKVAECLERTLDANHSTGPNLVEELVAEIKKITLLRHPRFHMHFTPTGGSWLNLVECWFALSPKSNCAAAFTAAPENSKTPSALNSNTTTLMLNPSSGPKPLTKSSTRLPDFVNEFQTQDTSNRFAKTAPAQHALDCAG